MIHCFTSFPELAAFAVDLGFFISFSGIVTFPNCGKPARTALTDSCHRTLVETDCPYLVPVPFAEDAMSPVLSWIPCDSSRRCVWRRRRSLPRRQQPISAACLRKKHRKIRCSQGVDAAGNLSTRRT